MKELIQSGGTRLLGGGALDGAIGEASEKLWLGGGGGLG